MVDKIDDPKPSDSRVTELMPGAHLELSSKVHDHLSNQCQPTRRQQGSQSAGFTMTELAYR